MIFGIRFLEVKIKFMVYHSVVYIEKKKGETNDLKNPSWGLKRKQEILTCFSNCNFENVHILNFRQKTSSPPPQEEKIKYPECTSSLIIMTTSLAIRSRGVKSTCTCRPFDFPPLKQRFLLHRLHTLCGAI